MNRRKFIKGYVKAGAAGLFLPMIFAPKASAVESYRVHRRKAFQPAGGLAVAFDSTFQKGVNTQTSPYNFVSNAGDVTGTVGSNTNRVLIACLQLRGVASSAHGVTWNGVAMTQIGSLFEPNANYDVSVWGLIAPATGNQTLEGTWTGGSAPNACLSAVSLYNAHQTTAWQNNGTDTATGTSALSTVTTADGNMALVFHLNDNASSTTIAQGTSLWVETDLNGNYAAGREASNAGSEVIEWTLGSSVLWGNFKLDVVKA